MTIPNHAPRLNTLAVLLWPTVWGDFSSPDNDFFTYPKSVVLVDRDGVVVGGFEPDGYAFNACAVEEWEHYSGDCAFDRVRVVRIAREEGEVVVWHRDVFGTHPIGGCAPFVEDGAWVGFCGGEGWAGV